MERIITVVLQRSGAHHMTSDKVTPEDAKRWADEGFHVFQLIARGKTWAFHYVNDSKIFTNLSVPASPDSDAGRHEESAKRLLVLRG